MDSKRLADLERCHREQKRAVAQVLSDELAQEWATLHGTGIEEARQGARLGLYDWVMEEVLILRETE